MTIATQRTTASGCAPSTATQRINYYLTSQSQQVLAASRLKSITTARKCVPQLIKAAQHIYDSWEQDDQGHDEEHGSGGICHAIADEFCNVFSKAGISSTSFNSSIGTNHVWTVIKVKEGVYSVDIPPSTYERGAGYTWTKLKGVRFTPDDIVFEHDSTDPSTFNTYLED